MLQMVKKRLADYGYEAVSADDTALAFLISKTDNYIMNFCNLSDVPTELLEAEADMICAEFLKTKVMVGGLDETMLKVDAVSSVTEGDTSVSYNGNSASASLMDAFDRSEKALFNGMMAFRRMRW